MANFFWPILFLLLFLNEKHFCSCKFTYTSVAPLTIVPGEAYQLTTNLEKADSLPVDFHYALVSQSNKTIIFKEDVRLYQLGSNTTAVSINPRLLSEDNYDLTLTIKEVSTTTVEDSKISIQKSIKTSSILIQTDKPIYKPGETVKFRVFVLNRFLLPFGEDKLVHITVTDPMKNVIKLWRSKEVKSGRGFVSEELELSKEPNLGQWKIQVKGNDQEDSKSFSVQEYVLPKYKVEIHPSPSFITYNGSKFVAEVSAMYTHGQPVNGECTVELSRVQPHYHYHQFSRNDHQRPSNKITKTARLEERKGLAKMEFDVKSELGVTQDELYSWGKSFEIFASCTDQASGNVRNATGRITMYESPFKFEIVEKPKKAFPGFPVDLTIKVSTQDDVPVPGDGNNQVEINIRPGNVTLKSVPHNGLVHVTFFAGQYRHGYYTIDITYKLRKKTLFLPISNMISESEGYIQSKLITRSPVEGQLIEVNVKTSQEYEALNLVLISRGVITHSERILVEGGDNKEQVIQVRLPPRSSPKVKLFIYLLSKVGNSVASDEMDIEVEPEAENRLEIILEDNNKIVQPGSNISISLKGSPNTFVGLRAVDQSVLLLKGDDDDVDLTWRKLRDVENSFGYRGSYSYHHWMKPQIERDFNDNGLGLMTNIRIQSNAAFYDEVMFTDYADRDDYSSGGHDVVMPMPGNTGSAHAPSLNVPPPPETSPAPPTVVRSVFPETWIWEDVDNSNGEMRIQKQVPDTITSWLISGFQIGEGTGLGLAKESQKLTVFRPFFISLNLPYSVVKGEVLFLQVLVHNYQDKRVTAHVTLENQEEGFTFLEEGKSTEDNNKMVRDVVVNASSIASIIFPIIPSKFGTITLLVRATTNDAGDAVRRTLTVRPPGIKHVQNSAVLINLLTESVFNREKITAVFPERRVEGADSLKVQVVGDVLGGSIDNIDKLIQLPTGCGEQNMVHFVPDLVILDYLNSTVQLTPQVETRVKTYLEKGYQQQLKYLRDDGSYSAFGKSDKVGSTWLTAFVTRAFIQAKQHILIDEDVIKKSLEFLLSKQNENGSFTEDGFVYDKSLQGGAAGWAESNHLAITAYSVLTIVEAQKANIDVTSDLSSTTGNNSLEEVITSGVNFLVEQTSGEEDFNDVYSANLISYLLHYINQTKKGSYFLLHYYFKMSEDLARIRRSNGTMHWRLIERQAPTTVPYSLQSSSRVWQRKVNPATVEVTSYGLLTYLLKGRSKLSDSLAIAKWLMRQRNPNGGFISTQDTVMGITALAKFAEAVNTKGNSKVKVKLTYGIGDDSSHYFYIGNDNRTVMQEYFLPDNNTTEVSIEAKAKGKATALAQLTWSYYVEAVDSSPAFQLKTEVTSEDNGRNLNMHIQFSYSHGGDEDEHSNMAILEANAPSGYAFDMEDLETLRRDRMFKRYELEDRDSKVQLYFDSVDSSPMTLNLKAYRVYLVARHAQGVVKIYDYYDNTQKAQNLYDVPSISVCDICENEVICDLDQCK